MHAVCREIEGGLARICNSLFLVVVILVLAPNRGEREYSLVQEALVSRRPAMDRNL